MVSVSVTDQTVLVTGGAGFIGSHLVEAFAADNQVRVLDDFSSGSRERIPDTATVVEGRVQDPEQLTMAMEGVDLVFHEAAQVSVEASIEAPVASHDTNVGGTLAVLEAASGVDARVIVASSAAVYGQPDAVPVSEDEPKTPRSPYGLEKLAVDQYTQLYHELYGLETTALRYFNVFGPRQSGGQYSGVIDTFVRQAIAGNPVTIHGDGEQTRDFVYVDDVVRANVVAATADEAIGEAFNVGTGSAVSIRELGEMIVEITESSSDIVHTEPRTGDIEHSQAATDRAESLLDFEAHTGLRDGLSDVIDWYRNVAPRGAISGQQGV